MFVRLFDVPISLENVDRTTVLCLAKLKCHADIIAILMRKQVLVIDIGMGKLLKQIKFCNKLFEKLIFIFYVTPT